jgi:hypothetical protein
MDSPKGSSLRPMENRPDYVPPQWRGGALNTWTAAKPSRVLGFFAFFLALDIAMIVWIVQDPKQVLLHTVYGPVLPFAILLFFFQFARYAPRAWRASRQGR